MHRNQRAPNEMARTKSNSKYKEKVEGFVLCSGTSYSQIPEKCKDTSGLTIKPFVKKVGHIFSYF